MKYLVVRKIAQCLSREVSVNEFFLVYDVCWLRYGVKDICAMYVMCLLSVRGWVGGRVRNGKGCLRCLRLM